MKPARTPVRSKKAVLVSTILVACSSQPDTLADRADDPSGPVFPMTDFSVLEGKWDVRSESLSDRLGMADEWQINRMETHYRILLDGLVAINDTYGTFDGRDMHGIMIRTYDPGKDEWLFQWMSNGYPHLTEQVRGHFENGVGHFYGREEHRGKEFRMRFRWRMTDENTAFWDQAYQDPVTLDWRTNWKLSLTRQ